MSIWWDFTIQRKEEMKKNQKAANFLKIIDNVTDFHNN